MLQKIKGSRVLVLLFAFSFITLFTISNSNAAGLSKIPVSYIVMEKNTGRILAEKNPDMKWRPASLTKIMTAILAMENAKLSDMMTVTKHAMDEIPEDYKDLKYLPGEKISLEGLLNAMLIISSNPSANIIAENISGSSTEFVKLMNQRALELGVKNTHFVNPYGATFTKNDDLQLSTARDMAILTQKAMSFKDFCNIVKKKYLVLNPTNKHSTWKKETTLNHFIQKDPNIYFKDGNSLIHFLVTGAKTGYTSKTKNNLVITSVDSYGMELITVVLGVESHNGSFEYASKLMKYGFKNYFNKTIVKKDTVLSQIKLKYEDTEHKIDLLAASNLKVTLSKDEKSSDIVKRITYKKDLVGPLVEGEIVGTVEYYYQKHFLGKVDLKK